MKKLRIRPAVDASQARAAAPRQGISATRSSRVKRVLLRAGQLSRPPGSAPRVGLFGS